MDGTRGCKRDLCAVAACAVRGCGPMRTRMSTRGRPVRDRRPVADARARVTLPCRCGRRGAVWRAVPRARRHGGGGLARASPSCRQGRKDRETETPARTRTERTASGDSVPRPDVEGGSPGVLAASVCVARVIRERGRGVCGRMRLALRQSRAGADLRPAPPRSRRVMWDQPIRFPARGSARSGSDRAC
jgi:hypothetical protein